MGSLLPSSSSSSCDLTNPSLRPTSIRRWRPPQNQQQGIPTDPTSSTTKRRALTLSVFPFLLFPHSSSFSSSSSAALSSLPTAPENATQLTLESYTDTAQGFTLLIPSSWSKVDKAGATALFEEGKGSSSNSIGIVVTPVRLSSLKDFGTPQFVADKLIQAERRKESTKQAEVIAVAERLEHGGLPVYEFEYIVDSTRGGMKRVFSAAFVASKKLYLLNIAHADKPDSPLDGQTRMVLEQVLHSFDTAL